MKCLHGRDVSLEVQHQAAAMMGCQTHQVFKRSLFVNTVSSPEK